MKEKKKFTYICCKCNNETDEYPSNSYCKECGNEDDFEEVIYRLCPGCESEYIEQHIPFCIDCFIYNSMRIKKSKRKRKCKAIPNKAVGYNACETCRRRGGKCYGRNKYVRDKRWRSKDDGCEYDVFNSI